MVFCGVLPIALQTMSREQDMWEAACLLSQSSKIEGRFVTLTDFSCQHTMDFLRIFNVG